MSARSAMARLPVPRAFERADDAGAGQPAMHLDAEFLEPRGDEFRGALLLEGGLGMGVDLVPPGGEVGMEIGNPVDDRHGRLLGKRRC